ncbi:Voltage-Dependent L-Type Calcium Channel Subunit Alpha-1C [Manis pentadactyla]|nr:Voltage-Dependent L-Type Calcium Channel Subunit Alpha-1C [Manis pentadactyla]
MLKRNSSFQGCHCPHETEADQWGQPASACHDLPSCMSLNALMMPSERATPEAEFLEVKGRWPGSQKRQEPLHCCQDPTWTVSAFS